MYKPDPTLSQAERLVVIETLLVHAMGEIKTAQATMVEQGKTIGRLQRALWVMLGFVLASGGGSLITILSTV